MKKMILLALAAASVAMFALPAVASAGTWHAEPPRAFAGTGGTMEWTTTAGNRVHCTSEAFSGEYQTTTTGTISIVYHGCKGPLGVSCQSAGQPAGTIATTSSLPFHNIHLEPDKSKPGILITPPTIDGIPTAGDGHIATFTCFGITNVWRGNGLIGEVTAPKCGETSDTMTIKFERAVDASGNPLPGHQKWQHVTTSGTTYDLKASIGGGAHSTLSIDSHTTAEFVGGSMQMNCT